MKYIPRKDLDVSHFDDVNEFQFKWIEIINDGRTNTLIGVCYRHPKKYSDNTFNDCLKKILDKTKKENKLVIIAGDFNYNLLEYKLNKNTNEFLNNMLGNFFQPCILEPTRVISNTKPSLIDNIYINTIDKVIKSCNFLDKISDHMPSFILLENVFYKKSAKEKIMIRDFKTFDKNQYLSDLEKLNITRSLIECNNVNSSYDLFHKEFMKIINKHAPCKTLSKREIKTRKKPWITNAIYKSIKVKNRLYGKFLKTKDKFWYERYKYYGHRIKSLINNSKQKYFKNDFDKFSKSSKKTWSGINQLLNKQNKKSCNEIFLNIDGEIITNQENVPNKFNIFFINIAKKLVDQLGEPNTEFQDYLKNPSESSFFIKEIEPYEVTKFIQN